MRRDFAIEDRVTPLSVVAKHASAFKTGPELARPQAPA
jgi:hypothetical protein